MINHIRKILILLLLCGLTVFVNGCSTVDISLRELRSQVNTVSYENKQEKKYGIELSDFNYDFVFPEDREIIDIANGLIDGKLKVYKNIEVVEYSFDEIDWNMQVTSSPSSFQLYLQACGPITYSTKAYEVTGDIKYLEYGLSYIKKWDEYRKSEASEGNSFVWYDHGTALRADYLIYFALVSEKEKEFRTEEITTYLYNLINEHAEYLENDKNYTKNHNHGIFQDQALLFCAYFLNLPSGKKQIDIAVNRLETQREYAFSDEMVHVENSPGYQSGVMTLFLSVADFLESMDHEYGYILKDNVNRASEFMAFITKPNGGIAEIGDTNGIANEATAVNYSALKFNNPTYSYAATLGKEGKIPEKNALFLPVSGYYISHNDWRFENYVNSTWAMFKSGYSSKTHKHSDDNSIMLYSKGKDIFVDCGWYNYMTGDKYRDYFVSSKSHNTVIVDDTTYSATTENSVKAGIYDYLDATEYDYVCGFNEMYEGVSVDRHFYNLGDAFIVYDNIVSLDEHVYSQLFHLSESVNLLSVSDNEALFSIESVDKKKYYVRIKQLNPIGDNTIIHGDFDKEAYGYLSKVQNTLMAIDTLKYDVTAKNADIITLITIEDENGQIDGINNIVFNPDTLSFYVEKEEGIEIILKPRERIGFDNVSVIQTDSNTFSFFNDDIGKADSFGAWYVIDKESASAVAKTDYTKNKAFTYQFEEEKSYLIRAYVKSGNGRYRRSNIIAEIVWNVDEKKYELVNFKKSGLNLRRLGQECKKIGENEYSFDVITDYLLNYRIRWYVYKNGGYFYNETKKNDSTMNVKFTEPGRYCVMYYLETSNGECEFWNYDEIVITE